MKIQYRDIIFLGLLVLVAAEKDVTKTEEECETYKKRFDWLTQVAEHGYVKCEDTLTPTEYKAIAEKQCDLKFTSKTIAFFKKELDSLAKKLTDFLKEHKELRSVKKEELENLLKKIETEFGKNESRAAKKYGKLVISSKKLLIDIFSTAGGEAQRVDIYAYRKDAEWKVLNFVFELSKIQCATLDKMIFNDIWEQHLTNWRIIQHNQKNTKNSKQHEKVKEHIGMRRAVVSGAGPSGLMATFLLFLAGMDVALVNDRMDYTRTQIVGFDGFWMSNMRYLLGTKYNQLFNIHNAPAGGLIAEERGIIGIRFVETAVKERLLELSEFVKEKRNVKINILEKAVQKLGKKLDHGGDGGDLNLHYGFKVDSVKEPANGEDSYFALVNNKDGKLAQRLPVDLLLCIGGANDKLRDKLIDNKIVPHSRTVNYVTGIFPKVQFEEGKIYYGEVAMPLFRFAKMDSLRTQLKRANFNAIIEKDIHLLPTNLHQSFNNFTEKLLESEEMYLIVSPENWKFLALGLKSPIPLEKLLKAIDNQIKVEKDTNKKENLKTFGRRILYKWCQAVFDYLFNAITNGNDSNSSTHETLFNIDENGDKIPRDKMTGQGVKIDIDEIGTRHFDVTVQTMENPVKEHTNGKHSVVVAALGDALASGHFYTGGGMSTGRKGVESMVKTVKELISGKMAYQEFVTKLTGALKTVAGDVVRLLAKYVPDEVLPAEVKT